MGGGERKTKEKKKSRPITAEAQLLKADNWVVGFYFIYFFLFIYNKVYRNEKAKWKWMGGGRLTDEML